MKERAPFSRECSYNESISKSAGKAGKSNKSQIGLSDSQLQSVLFYTHPLQSNVHCVGKKFIKFDIVVLVNGVPFHLSVYIFLKSCSDRN